MKDRGDMQTGTAGGGDGDRDEALDRTESITPGERVSRGSMSGIPVRRTSPIERPVDAQSSLGDLDEHGQFVGNPDRYAYAGEQGRGGLGRVVRAEDKSLLRTVAIKELLGESESAATRFMREALVTARLEHPGIVPVYEAGQWPTGEPYYVMKLVSGRTLKDLARSRENLGERLALLPNVIAVAEAIAYAHSAGVIHRDLKPSNVVVGEFGETVVIDWGVAKDLEQPYEDLPPAMSGVSGEHTAVGDVLGTPAYMPPEQARGDDVDERADVFSIGAMLYEMLSGKPPYAGIESEDIVAHVLREPPEPLDQLQPGVPLELLAIVRKAMERDVDERYPTAKELAEDLKRFQTGQLVTAHRYSTSTLLKRWLWRHRGVVGVAIVCLAALAAVGAVSFRRVVAQRNVAEAQRAQAEERGKQLVFLQAETSLDRDPTAAIAWLKFLAVEGDAAIAAHAMVDEARARGVARHVFQTGDAVRIVAFSPNGAWLAPASRDGIARMWSLDSGEEVRLGEHEGGITSVVFARDGTMLATGGLFGTVLLWDLETGKARTLGSHERAIMRLVFSRDGSRLLSADEGGGGRAWNAQSGEQVAKSDAGAVAGDISAAARAVAVAKSLGDVLLYDLENKKRRELTSVSGRVGKLRFSPDGTRVVIHSRDGKLQLVDVAAGAVRELGEREGQIYGIEFSRDGRRVATAGVDGVAHVWDLDSGEVTTLRGHDDAIYMAVFSPDADKLVTAGDDATARVWNLRTGSVHVLRGHGDDVLTVEFSPDGKSVATGSMDGSVRVWPLGFDDSRVLLGDSAGARRIRAPRIGWSLSDGIGHLVLAEDDRIVVSHSGGGELRAWDAWTGQSRVLGHARDPKAGLVPERPVVSRDGRFVATRGEGFEIDLWEVQSGERHALRAHQGKLASGGFTPDGRFLVSSASDGKVIFWDTLTRAAARVFDAGEPVRWCAVSADGARLAVLTASRASLREASDFREVSSIDLPSDLKPPGATRVGFSPDGRWLLVLLWSAPDRLWDLSTGEVKEIGTDLIGPTSIQFSPDGKLLAAAGGDRTILVWETESLQKRVLTGHSDLIFQLAFFPDGERLASVSYDRTLRIWDLFTGGAQILRGHASGVATLDISRDGSFVVTGGDDNTVRVWDIGEEPSYAAASVRARLDELTSAVIGEDDRPHTAPRIGH